MRTGAWKIPGARLALKIPSVEQESLENYGRWTVLIRFVKIKELLEESQTC